MAWVKERLGVQLLYVKERAEVTRLEALCARLPESTGAEAVRRRCLSLKRSLAPLPRRRIRMTR